jgi:hypothetical protein
VEELVAQLAQETGLCCREDGWLSDGGNFVVDYGGNAVASRKFFRDNNLSENTAVNAGRNQPHDVY